MTYLYFFFFEDKIKNEEGNKEEKILKESQKLSRT